MADAAKLARILDASIFELLEMFTAGEADVQEVWSRLSVARMYDWPGFLAALRWMHSDRNKNGLYYTYGVQGHLQPCACQSCQGSALTKADFDWLVEHGWSGEETT